MSKNPPATPAPEPTAEQLAMAYRHINRPGCPDTLEAALASPVWATCIRQLARQLHRARPCIAAPVRRSTAYVPPTPTAPRQATQPGRRFDARRAAANDFDD